MYIIVTDQHVTCATTEDEQKAVDYVRRLKEQGIYARYIKLEEEK